MRQFVLPDDWAGGPVLELRGNTARRLRAVLRLRPGDCFPARSSDGSAFECSVRRLDRDAIELSVAPTSSSANLDAYKPDIRSGRLSGVVAADESVVSIVVPLPDIILGLGILKGNKMDEVVRAAAEAGVTRIVPLLAERCIQPDSFTGRLDRLQRLTREALGQSGTSGCTSIDRPCCVAAFAARNGPAATHGIGLVFHERPLASTTIHGYCTDTPEVISACVGPEGGFTDTELELLESQGFRRAWLGPGVLRAETAGIFAVASIRIICLERSSWSMRESNG
jgi:RsmE family RNA methyltransferase